MIPDGLLERYAQARAVTNQYAKYMPGLAPPDTCRYCGEHWRLWAGSKLDGHARCLVTPLFKTWLLRASSSPKITSPAIAAAIGVTVSVVRSWIGPTVR